MMWRCVTSMSLVFIVCLFACNKPDTHTDTNQAEGMTSAGIDTAYFVSLGGLDQYVEIRGASESLPILLFLHGGPSIPATPMLRFYNADLGESFIVVSWDQRGCGHSAVSDPRPEDMSLERFIADAHELTAHLRHVYGHEKLFLVGHSWGSIIGIELVRRYPEDYLAYIGIGQVVNTAEGEARSRRELASRARAAGDGVILSALEEIGFTAQDGYTDGLEGFLAHRRLLWQYGMHDYDNEALTRAIQASSDYSKDIKDWMMLAAYAQGALYETVMSFDITRQTDFEIPIYFFAGRHDFNTPQSLVGEYFKTINAPLKRMYWFEQSGHSPPWEEPDLFGERLRELSQEVLGMR